MISYKMNKVLNLFFYLNITVFSFTFSKYGNIKVAELSFFATSVILLFYLCNLLYYKLKDFYFYLLVFISKIAVVVISIYAGNQSMSNIAFIMSFCLLLTAIISSYLLEDILNYKGLIKNQFNLGLKIDSIIKRNLVLLSKDPKISEKITATQNAYSRLSYNTFGVLASYLFLHKGLYILSEGGYNFFGITFVLMSIYIIIKKIYRAYKHCYKKYNKNRYYISIGSLLIPFSYIFMAHFLSGISSILLFSLSLVFLFPYFLLFYFESVKLYKDFINYYEIRYGSE